MENGEKSPTDQTEIGQSALFDLPGMDAPAGWSVNRLARELNFDRRTVTKRLVNVEPLGEGKNGPVYDLANAVRALFGVTSLTEKDSLDRRILTAKAEAAELDLAAKRGELLDAAAVRKAATANARMEREALLNWPDQIAPMMAAELEVDESLLVTILAREIRELMEARADDAGI